MAGEDAHAASAAAFPPNWIPASEKRGFAGVLPSRGTIRSEQQRCGSKPDRFRHRGGANLDRERRRGNLSIANTGTTKQRAEALGRARKRIPVWMRQRVCPGKRTTAPDRSASAGERVASGSTIVVSGRRPMPPRTGGTDKATRADRSSAFPGLRKGGRASVRGTRCVRISIGVRRAGNRVASSDGRGAALHFDEARGAR